MRVSLVFCSSFPSDYSPRRIGYSGRCWVLQDSLSTAHLPINTQKLMLDVVIVWFVDTGRHSVVATVVNSGSIYYQLSWVY